MQSCRDCDLLPILIPRHISLVKSRLDTTITITTYFFLSNDDRVWNNNNIYSDFDKTVEAHCLSSRTRSQTKEQGNSRAAEEMVSPPGIRGERELTNSPFY